MGFSAFCNSDIPCVIRIVTEVKSSRSVYDMVVFYLRVCLTHKGHITLVENHKRTEMVTHNTPQGRSVLHVVDIEKELSLYKALQ